MISIGNATFPTTVTNTTFPYGPFAERYNSALYTQPIAGRSLAGQYPVLGMGISGSKRLTEKCVE